MLLILSLYKNDSFVYCYLKYKIKPLIRMIKVLLSSNEPFNKDTYAAKVLSNLIYFFYFLSYIVFDD